MQPGTDRDELYRIKRSPRLKRPELKKVDAAIADLEARLRAAHAVREWLLRRD